MKSKHQNKFDSPTKRIGKFHLRNKTVLIPEMNRIGAHLILELDEHSAAAGVMTRLEAYKNVIENSMQASQPQPATQLKTINSHKG
jgi:hypothetical protein